MNHYSHAVRFAFLLVIIAALFFIVRAYLVPESFEINDGSYTYGYYRADSVKEQAALYPRHQGPEKCLSCHEEQYAALSDSSHTSVGCETCHGYWQAHNNNMKDEIIQDTSVTACMQCHEYLAARPAAFPQISDFKGHVLDQEETYTESMLCVECHDPHAPL